MNRGAAAALIAALVILPVLLACDRPSPGGSTDDAPGGAGGSSSPGGLGGDGGAGGGTGGATVPACDLHVPAFAGVGPAPAGIAARADLSLVNEGEAACELLAVELDGCGGEFSVARPEEGIVPAGGTLAIPVTLAPEGEPDPSCTLRVVATDRVHEVVLRGYRDPGCLSVDRAALDFGAAEVRCGHVVREFVLRNGCGVEATLTAATSPDGSAFSVEAGDVPLPIGPGAFHTVVVGWRPVVPGPNHAEVRLAFAPDGASPLVVTVSGLGSPAQRIVDRYRTPARPKVDVLFVIDDGVAMAPFASRVVEGLAGFADAVGDIYGRDFHLAVTTTGLIAEPGAGCPGGAEGGADGRLLPLDGTRPRILARDTPGLRAAWESALAVGACRTGPSMPLEAALRALTPPVADQADDPRHPEAGDGNLGFLREDARLSLVFVGARSDVSPAEVTSYYNSIMALKGFRNTHLFSAHAIVGDDATGCANESFSAESGSKAIRLAEKTDGGTFHSICAGDWDDDAWRSIATGPYYFASHWIGLTAWPADENGDGAVDEDDLVVRVEGVEVPAVGPQGRRTWVYRPESNLVQFDVLSLPEPERLVEVEYTRRCP